MFYTECDGSTEVETNTEAVVGTRSQVSIAHLRLAKVVLDCKELYKEMENGCLIKVKKRIKLTGRRAKTKSSKPHPLAFNTKLEFSTFSTIREPQ